MALICVKPGDGQEAQYGIARNAGIERELTPHHKRLVWNTAPHSNVLMAMCVNFYASANYGAEKRNGEYVMDTKALGKMIQKIPGVDKVIYFQGKNRHLGEGSIKVYSHIGFHMFAVTTRGDIIATCCDGNSAFSNGQSLTVLQILRGFTFLQNWEQCPMCEGHGEHLPTVPAHPEDCQDYLVPCYNNCLWGYIKKETES